MSRTDAANKEEGLLTDVTSSGLVVYLHFALYTLHNKLLPW